MKLVSGSSIEFENVSKRYGALAAITNFRLTIEAGEFVSLLGPSGSGKTTLLMMLAGFERPTLGRVLIGGRDVTPVPPNKRDIGMVFQRYALFPHLTVAQNIAFPLRMRKMPKADIRREVDRIINLIRLPGLENRLPNQLSGGQQQRVAVGRALVFNPSVLLMDEPLGALDKKLREQMQIEIKQLQKSLGVTVMYVTHDQDEALTMSDRVAVIHQGRLAQIGSPTDLYVLPANAFVADFVGKMNFIEASFIGEEQGWITLRIGNGCTMQASEAPSQTLVKEQKVRVAVRPEQLTVCQPDKSLQHALRGAVETSIFVGSLQILLIRIHDVLIQVHALAGGEATQYRVGEEVLIAYDPGNVRIFPL
jgi:mannopine transport system ATP-binding protein